MSARRRSEGNSRIRGRRVYSNRIEPAASTPLQTLLHLVSLKAEHDHAAVNVRRPTDEDLREVVSALYEVATGNFDWEQVLALATRRACSMTGATGAAIALQQGEAYICRSSLGANAPSVGASFSADSGISGQCVQTAQILTCRDTDFDSRVNASVCRHLGIRSMVAVPIFNSGAVCGILEVFAEHREAFNDADTYLLQLISSLVGYSVQERLSAPAAQKEAPNFATLAHKQDTQQPTGSVLASDRLEQFEPPVSTTRSRIAAGFAVGAVLFTAVWFTIPRSAPTSAQVSSPVQEAASVLARAPEVQSLTTPAEISGIEFKSHGQFTAIRIAAARAVTHQSGRLQNPERIYFDLFDTDLAASFGGHNGTTIEVKDPYVSRIRAVQTSGHNTRIVLDLKCACDYTAVSPDKPPYGLSILVQPPHASRQRGFPPSRGVDFVQPAAISDGVLHTSSGKLTIVIDPGHGGTDLGTTGPDGLAEKDLVLDIAHRLATLLAGDLGANVVFTRADDRFISLERREQIANEAHADLLISVHANSSTDRLTRGVETYYYTAATPAPGNTKAGPTLQPVSLDTQGAPTRTLAGLVQRELYTALSREDQALRNRGVKKAQFALLMNADMPAVLTEVAFISSPSDERKLSRPETRQVIAKGLFQGISGFVNRQSPKSGL